MPAGKKTARNYPRKKTYRRKTYRRKSKLANSEFASASQTLKLTDDQMNNIFRIDNISLRQFDRLVNIAKNYQFYRITKCEFKITPYADTYQTSGFDGAGSPEPHSSVPYLYWLINRGQTLVTATFNSLQDAGAKPNRFDDKTVRINWKPSVNMVTRATDSVTPAINYGVSKVSPWLSTNDTAGQDSVTWTPSNIPHMGLLYGVQQDYVVGPEGYQNVYGTQITIHVQFKKPLNAPGSGKSGMAILKDLTPKED